MTTTRPSIHLDEYLFRELFNAAPDPTFIIQEDGRIVMANAEAERVFGYEHGELVGQMVEVIVPPRYRGLHAGQRETYGRAPQTRRMGMGRDLTAHCKDGRELPVEISLSPLQTAQGLLVIGTVRDITERQHAERALTEKAAALQRSNAELEQFAYVASHDLQEPLRAIAGACQILQRRYGEKLDASATEYFGFAVDGAKRLQELISDLLEFSRVTTKGKPPVPTDVESVLRRVIANLQVQIAETGASVTHDPMPQILADAGQLAQVLQNLISNGLKFRDDKPPAVHISAEKQGGDWIFSVRDNGIGIDPKYFPRLFVIFKRLHPRDRYPGTGIGLALCKKIVERHGGRIWVESGSGKGSTFRFSLPSA